MARQMMKVYYDYDGKHSDLPPRPTKAEIEVILASDECPLSKIIVRPGSTAEGGNEDAIKLLKTFAFTSHTRHDHSCRGMNIGMYGSTGQGKTYVVERWAETTNLNVIKLNAGVIESSWTIYEALRESMEAAGTPLEIENGHGRATPHILFIDEAHKLKKRLAECDFLNAMESSDGTLYCVERRNGPIITLDVSEVCWVVATTDEAKLFSAFRRRLNAIQWNDAGPEELKHIVKMRMDKDYYVYTKNKKTGKMDHTPDIPSTLPLEACDLIFKYQQIPGKAVDFARNMAFTRNREGGSWENTCESVRKALGFDEHGMHYQQLKILIGLGQHPIALGNLNIVARCEQEKVEEDHLPEMMCFVGDRPWCKKTHRGVAITRSGLAQLDLRGIPNEGDYITAEAMMERSAA